MLLEELKKNHTNMSNKAKRSSISTGRTTTVKKPKIYLEDPKSAQTNILNILNLNDDCLAEIFSYLNDRELLNVIRSNTRFKLPCGQAYKRKYCRDPVIVGNLRLTRETKHSISILEHFGHLISKLCIRFKLDKIERLLDAVVANCDENLLELELDNLSVRGVKPNCSYARACKKMKSFLSNLPTQFTNLHHLKLDCSCNVSIPYSDEIIKSFPTLKSFATTETFAGKLFSEVDLQKFLQLNRQLESLSLQIELNAFLTTHHSWSISQGFITFLDRTLPLLKCLEINRVSTRYIPKSIEYPMIFKNLKQLTFCKLFDGHYKDRGIDAFLSESVEVLKLSNSDTFTNAFLQSVTRFPKLKVLELEWDALTLNDSDNRIWSPNGIRRLILDMPQLTQITIRQRTCYIYSIITPFFINEYENVTKDKLNGAQWDVSGDFDIISFRKVLEI